MTEDSNKKAEPSIPSLLTPDDLARVLQLSTRSVRRLVDQGHCPKPVKVSGRAIRWEPTAVQEWIASGCPRCRKPPAK
jgi:excisionase family DNA binding protein